MDSRCGGCESAAAGGPRPVPEWADQSAGAARRSGGVVAPRCGGISANGPRVMPESGTLHRLGHGGCPALTALREPFAWQAGDECGDIRVPGLPERVLEAGEERDRLARAVAYRRATPEAALLHWLYLPFAAQPNVRAAVRPGTRFLGLAQAVPARARDGSIRASGIVAGPCRCRYPKVARPSRPLTAVTRGSAAALVLDLKRPRQSPACRVLGTLGLAMCGLSFSNSCARRWRLKNIFALSNGINGLCGVGGGPRVFGEFPGRSRKLPLCGRTKNVECAPLPSLVPTTPVVSGRQWRAFYIFCAATEGATASICREIHRKRVGIRLRRTTH